MEILRRDGPTEATRQHDSELGRRQGTAWAAKLASAHSTVCIQPGVPLLHREAEHFGKPELAVPQKLLPRELRYHVQRFADCSSRKGMKSGQDTDALLLCLDTAIVHVS